MKTSLMVLAAALMLSAPASATQTKSFDNPCDRGPVPHWSLINSSRTPFVSFLQDVRPKMPNDVAQIIAYEMCDDMQLVGDSSGLTQRLNLLLKKYGY